jgi:alkylation response protein AidB-like acyl-CoA dehydrogenase
VLVGTDIVPVADVNATPIRGLDPAAGLHTVTFGDNSGSIRSGSVAKGQVALAFQLAGASRAMLELACAHALEREQFGRAVASFQAVRHRLAEALVAVEAAEAAGAAALDDGGPVAAALAKAIAGRSARTVAKHAQQVLAGIGFTTEHSFHRYLKRTMVLDGLFGSTDALVVDLGHHLLATRAVPTLIEL